MARSKLKFMHQSTREEINQMLENPENTATLKSMLELVISIDEKLGKKTPLEKQEWVKTLWTAFTLGRLDGIASKE